MISTDTIAAIATPIGSAGIGVIRISGPKSFEIAGRIFKPAGDYPSHTAHHGKLIDPTTNEAIDDVVMTVFRGPTSYTGEDVIEVSCHGGYAILRAALNAILDAGARLAEPGEFTKRAFLNGKIDLAQAEAVNDLIRADTDGARRVALRQLDGALSEQLREASNRLLGIIATVEAAVDFPEDVPEPESDWLIEEIRTARNIVDELLESFGKGRICREGMRVVIAGRVNVGKSSLLNALLRHARAIVTPIPGTTRDVIEESMEIEGVPVVAIDTAGLRATDDPVERMGVELTRKSMESADVVLAVVDAIDGCLPDDIEPAPASHGARVIVVMNKIDLVPEPDQAALIEHCSQVVGEDVAVVAVSAVTGVGVDTLERQIASVAMTDTSGGGAMVTNARHRELLLSASESLRRAVETVEEHQPIDLLSIDLTAARASLGLITGETAGEDLLDRIFAEFCIGK